MRQQCNQHLQLAVLYQFCYPDKNIIPKRNNLQKLGAIAEDQEDSLYVIMVTYLLSTFKVLQKLSYSRNAPITILEVFLQNTA